MMTDRSVTLFVEYGVFRRKIRGGDGCDTFIPILSVEEKKGRWERGEKERDIKGSEKTVTSVESIFHHL